MLKLGKLLSWLLVLVVLGGALTGFSFLQAQNTDPEVLPARSTGAENFQTAGVIQRSRLDEPHSLFLKALTLEQDDQRHEAIAVYTEITKEFPHLPEAFNNLAALHVSAGQLDKALLALEHALTLDKAVNDAVQNLRVAYQHAASHAYRQVMRVPDQTSADMDEIHKSSDLIEPSDNLAALNVTASQLDEARLALERVLAGNNVYKTVFRNLNVLINEMTGRAYRQALPKNVDPFEPVRLTTIDDIYTPLSAPAQLVSNDDKIAADSKPQTVVAKPAATVVLSESKQANPVDESTDRRLTTSSNDNPAGREVATILPVEDIQSSAEADNLPVAPPAVSKPGEKEKPEATIVSATASPAKSHLAIKKEVITTVQQWAEAWSSQDLSLYLSHYASEFKPEKSGLNRDAWEKQRRNRIQWRNYIRVAISEPKVKLNGDAAEVSFEQSYKSDVYQDEVVKTMQLQRVNNEWKITRERVKS